MGIHNAGSSMESIVSVLRDSKFLVFMAINVVNDVLRPNVISSINP